MSRFLPADHARGDETTVGGYEAVHGRPVSFDGPDGFAYSVAVIADALGDDARGAWGAYFLFLRWRRVGEEGVEGHVESDFLAFGESREVTLAALGAWRVEAAQEHLAGLIAAADPGSPYRWPPLDEDAR